MPPKYPTKRVVFCLLLAALCCRAESHGQTGRDRLVLLDGTTITGTIASIDAKGRITLEKGKSTLRLDGLRRIERLAETPPHGAAAAPLIVELLGGGRLTARTFEIRDEQCNIQWRHGTLSVPLEVVRAVRLDPQRKSPEFDKALGGEEESDRIFVRTDDKLVAIEGFVESLDDEQVVLEWDGRQRTIPRAQLHGIVFALLDTVPDHEGPGRTGPGHTGPGHTGKCRLELHDGSSLWGRIESLKTDTQGGAATLTCRLGDDADMALPWDAVARVVVQSDRLVYLSDLTPVKVEEESIVAFPRSWQPDKSVGRRPLRLGTRTFDKGIGVQPTSRLVFNAGGRFEWLTATIGIDAETAGRGDCLFIVLGDGQQRFRKRVKGGDPPSELRVDIQGVKEVTLMVEPGEDLDLGDHADWCEACFIRPAKSEP